MLRGLFGDLIFSGILKLFLLKLLFAKFLRVFGI